MGKNKKALADFEAANEYPENLEEGRPEFNIRFAQIYYYLGLGNELTGNFEAAREYYRKAADENVGSSGYLYYNYLANSKLGEKEKAIQSAGQLRQLAEEGSDRDFFAKFGSRMSPNMAKADLKYMEGIADLAEGKDDKARDAFSEALELNPKHSWAKVQLAEIDRK
jgi:tetratricopeptide (TPR) repeat protein